MSYSRVRIKPQTSSVMRVLFIGTSVLVSALTVFGMSPTATSAIATATSTANLGSAANFSVLGGAAATIPSSTLGGEVGAVSAITVNPATILQSTVHTAYDAATQTALSDATAAYNALGALSATGTLISDDLAGQVITPGVYRRAAYSMTTQVTFDGMNDPNALFIMQSDGALNTTASTTMNLINGAQANQIFWVITTAATLGASSTFYGTMLTGAAITVGASSTVCGRALSVLAAVTLDANIFCRLAAT